jgi:tetratricopeptide (TPR) repeat protein
VAFAATQRNYLASSASLGLEILRAGLVDGESPFAEHRMAIRESAGELALQLWRTGNGCKALALARSEVVHPHTTIESLLSAEEVLHAEADWVHVAQATSRLKTAWPNRAEGYLWAGDALVRQARFEEAIPDLERALALDYFGGFSLSLLRALGRAYLLTGRYDQGRTVLTNLLARDPGQKDMASLLRAPPHRLAEIRRELEADARIRERSLEFADHPF